MSSSDLKKPLAPEPNIWYVCKFCRRAFQEAARLIAHKKQDHRPLKRNAEETLSMKIEAVSSMTPEVEVSALKTETKKKRKDGLGFDCSLGDYNSLTCRDSTMDPIAALNDVRKPSTRNKATAHGKTVVPEVLNTFSVNPLEFDATKAVTTHSSVESASTLLQRVESTAMTNGAVKLKLKLLKPVWPAVGLHSVKGGACRHGESAGRGRAVPGWVLHPDSRKSVIHSLINRELSHQIAVHSRSKPAIYCQLQKRCIQQTNENGKDNAKTNSSIECHRPGLPRSSIEVLTSNRANPTSRNWILESKPSSYPKFDIMEDQLYLLVSKPTPEMIFFNIEPGAENFTRVACSRSKPIADPKSVGEDMDVFYIDTASPEYSGPGLHTMLVTIPSSQDRLVLYDMENGKLAEEFVFNTNIRYHTLNCTPDGRIVVQSHLFGKGGVFKEILILSYPPLKLEARIQVLQAALDKGSIQGIEIYAEFVMLLTFGGHMQLCCLEELLHISELREPHDPASADQLEVTHVLQEFPKPFLSVQAEYLLFGLPVFPAYYLIRDKYSYKLMELTHAGPVPVKGNNLLEMEHEDMKDVNPYFMKHTNRLVLVGKSHVRILDIRRLDSAPVDGAHSKENASLVSIFDKDFRTDAPDRPSRTSNGWDTVCYRSGRLRRSRQNSSYSEESNDDFVLCYDDNYSLQQFAIVRFKSDQITAFVYSSKTFKLNFTVDFGKLRSERFRIPKEILEADITCRFTPALLVVRYSQKNHSNKEHRILFIFDLVNNKDDRLCK